MCGSFPVSVYAELWLLDGVSNLMRLSLGPREPKDSSNDAIFLFFLGDGDPERSKDSCVRCGVVDVAKPCLTRNDRMTLERKSVTELGL